MAQGYIPNDLFIQGALSAKQTILSAGCVNDAAVQANAQIGATKLVHQFAKEVQQDVGVNCVSKTDLIHTVFAAGTGVSTVAGFQAAVVTPPTGNDTLSIDLQRSTAGGAFASILTAPISITSTTPARTVQTASINGGSLNGGDILQVVVTYTHGTGTAPQGLIAECFLRENPQ